ncbi:hypothetical protein ACFZBU_39810 [Embleya sp. NPDC008237]|uniref:hypothetical protein n=1 Tax=Embleya sp. NPDC008237 TaxID=3363978 RepID=UPI0036E57623
MPPTTESPRDTDPTALRSTLHRRVDLVVANQRAADQKAGLLLAGTGLVAPGLRALQGAAVYGAGAGLAMAAVLLVWVLLPRTHGTLRVATDPDTTLRLLTESEQPQALAQEYQRMSRIANVKFTLIQAALLVLGLTAGAVALASSL